MNTIIENAQSLNVSWKSCIFMNGKYYAGNVASNQSVGYYEQWYQNDGPSFPDQSPFSAFSYPPSCNPLMPSCQFSGISTRNSALPDTVAITISFVKGDNESLRELYMGICDEVIDLEGAKVEIIGPTQRHFMRVKKEYEEIDNFEREKHNKRMDEINKCINKLKDLNHYLPNLEQLKPYKTPESQLEIAASEPDYSKCSITIYCNNKTKAYQQFKESGLLQSK